MAVTISPYNHTTRRFAAAQNNPSDTYVLLLCTAATFDAADELLADVSFTEVADGNGYAEGGQVLLNVAVSTVNTTDAKFDADDVIWTADGGSIEAEYGILVLANGDDNPPLFFIDFDGSRVALDGDEFPVIWDADGIFTFEVTS
jgi:hypothetical protein